MSLTRLETDAIEDEAVTSEKIKDGDVNTIDVSAEVLEAGVSFAIALG